MNKSITKSTTIVPIIQRLHKIKRYFYPSKNIQLNEVPSELRKAIYFLSRWASLGGIAILWLMVINFASLLLFTQSDILLIILSILTILVLHIIVYGVPLLLFCFFLYPRERRIVIHNLFLNLLYGANGIICLSVAAFANKIGNNSFKEIIINPFLDALARELVTSIAKSMDIRVQVPHQ